MSIRNIQREYSRQDPAITLLSKILPGNIYYKTISICTASYTSRKPTGNFHWWVWLSTKKNLRIFTQCIQIENEIKSLIMCKVSSLSTYQHAQLPTAWRCEIDYIPYNQQKENKLTKLLSFFWSKEKAFLFNIHSNYIYNFHISSSFWRTREI